MNRGSRVVVVAATAGLVLGLTVALPTGVGYAAYRSDRARLTVLPEGSRVGGVEVGGLDRAAAEAAVRAVTERDVDRPAVLLVAGRRYAVTARALGVTADAAAAVDAAVRDSRRGSWLSRSWHRLTGSLPAPQVPVEVTAPSIAALRALAARAAAEASSTPVDATVQEHHGWLRFTAAHLGQRLDPGLALAALTASLHDGVPRRLTPAAVPPAVDPAAVRTVILVRTGENRLYVYQDGHLARSFPVATGSPDFPTPTGLFHVTLKRYLPTWVNPHPDQGWGKLEPATIPPGPSNPLGTRAMNLSAPNIRIHGTPSAGSIGYSVSHGCIRMRISDVEALYPMVPTGADVFIVSAGPPRLPPPGAHVAVASLAEGG